tara:strand:+ start:1293 stop:2069 length:777 start_codon:yes stop_codon:yes gene_type:complete
MQDNVYLDRDTAITALKGMQEFHSSLLKLHEQFDMNLLDNLGRRNILLSQPQEHFFAKALSQSYTDVINDGRTGQADIYIGELEKELECKLTTRMSSGAINFQTDHATLVSKGALDYLYVIASDDFNEFAVLLFSGLTVDEFNDPPESARGKARMIKWKAMEKCTILVGEVIDNNEIQLLNLTNELKEVTYEKMLRIVEIQSRIEDCSNAAKVKRRNLNQTLIREVSRYDKKIMKINDKLFYWTNEPSKYSIELEKIS